MQLNKSMGLNFLLHWFAYELVLLLGIGTAYLGLILINLDNYLPNDFIVNSLLITLSFATISLFAGKLRGKITLNPELLSYLLITFFLASLVNFPAVFTLSVILATTFLYECYPFYLRRWSGFFAIKYAVDMTAVFLLGLFLLWQYISGAFALGFFCVFYLAAVLVQRIIKL